jgi:hypothetical protein
MRAPAPAASAVDTLIEKVGTDIDTATAPTTKKKQSQKQLAKATEKAKEQARQRAVLALAVQVRSEVPDRARLDALLDDSSVSDEAKVATHDDLAPRGHVSAHEVEGGYASGALVVRAGRH